MEAFNRAQRESAAESSAPAFAPFRELPAGDGAAAGHNQRVARVIERVTQLPFSPVAMKIVEVARDERAGAREMAKIIVLDQAFTARLLRIANSPFYGQSREVTTVSQAVSILGMEAIASLALTLFTFGAFADEDNEILSIGQLWEHSLGCAVWCRAIATLVGRISPEEAFIAGLLHDMGKVLLYRFFKKELLNAVQIAESEGLPLCQAEQRTLGTDHMVVGQAAANQWGFPPLLRYSIGFHSAPAEVPQNADDSVRKIVAIVHLADRLCESSEIGKGGDRGDDALDGSVWPFLKVTEAQCREMLGGVQAELEKSREMFAMALGWRNPVKRDETDKSNGRANGKAAAAPQAAPAAATAPSASDAGAYFARFVEAGKQISMLAGLDEMLPNIASHAVLLLGADAAEILLPKAEALEIAGAVGTDGLLGATISADGSLAGWVARMKEAMVIADIERATPSWEKDFFGRAGYRSHLLLPVEWAGKAIAVLSVHSRKERQWTPQEISGFNNFVGLVAVALENARLYRESAEEAVTLQKLNKALQEALRVKEKFLHIMSHELRTPLSIIMAYPGMVLNNLFGEPTPEIRTGMQKILKAAEHLLSMIDAILDLTQIEGDLLKVRREPLELSAMLEEAALHASGLVAGKPVVLERDYGSPLPMIFSDAKRVKQVLICLLDNAAKFTRAGKIVLGSFGVEGGVEIFVQDTGIGIEEPGREIIFDRFRQLDDGDSRHFGGLGLGLYTVRRVLDLLEGQITVESEPGKGSIFRIRLPLGRPAQAAA